MTILRSLRDLASHRRRNHAELVHQLGKLFRVERLRAVGERFIGLVMDLNEHGIGARGSGGKRHGGYFVAASGAVRGIGRHWKMREFVNDGDRGNIHRVTSVSFKSADAATK